MHRRSGLRMRRAAGICAALSALVLLSACGLGAYAPESTPAETESTAPETDGGETEAPPEGIHIF